MAPMVALLSVVPEVTMKVEPSEQDLNMATRWAPHRSTLQLGAKTTPMALMVDLTVRMASTRATRLYPGLMDAHLL